MVQDIKTAHRAAVAVLATVLWEFFSYSGLRALLILYLVQSLHYHDTRAYALFGGYLSLLFLTPMIGGWLADRIFGFKTAVIMGCIAMVIGHFTLGIFGNAGLLWGLAWIIVGIGFFKTNAICLLADCYQHYPTRQESIYVWYYVVASLGSAAGAVICAIVAKYLGWRYGFATAGVGMTLGLLILLAHRRFLHGIGPAKVTLSTLKYSFYRKAFVVVGILLAVVAATWVLKTGTVLWVLVVTAVAALPFIVSMTLKAGYVTKRNLALLLVFALISTLFWAFNEQGGSSISLFILRDVNRHIGSFTIPTAWFQSVNPVVILICGPLIAFMWRWLARKQIHFIAAFKIAFGVLLLTCGFIAIMLGEKFTSTATGLINMTWPIIGLGLIGISELFVDPVILNEITKKSPTGSRGFLTGIYYVFIGAYASYISIQIARLSVSGSHSIHATLGGYFAEFNDIVTASAILVIITVMVGVVVLKNKWR